MSTTTDTVATPTTTWNVDTTHAEIGFAVRHLMISTVRGRFGAVTGTVVMDEIDPANSTVDVTVDIGSIDTRQEQRDAHLRSPDFFDAATFPTMRFASTRFEGDPTGDFTLTGNLTIRDVTREVTLEGSAEGRGRDPWGGERAGFHAKGKISRGDFGLTWNQALETGGVVVGDEVKITIDAELIRQAVAA